MIEKGTDGEEPGGPGGDAPSDSGRGTDVFPYGARVFKAAMASTLLVWLILPLGFFMSGIRQAFDPFLWLAAELLILHLFRRWWRRRRRRLQGR